MDKSRLALLKKQLHTDTTKVLSVQERRECNLVRSNSLVERASSMTYDARTVIPTTSTVDPLDINLEHCRTSMLSTSRQRPTSNVTLASHCVPCSSEISRPKERVDRNETEDLQAITPLVTRTKRSSGVMTTSSNLTSQPAASSSEISCAKESVNLDEMEAMHMISAELIQKHVSIVWNCTHCRVECVPVRRESRCLCGHRLKEHAQPPSAELSSIAEGAWVLRCRCKHKHIEHDCSSKPYVCRRCRPTGTASATCSGFDSPWVCNCGHPWAAHVQSTVVRSAIESGAQLQDILVPSSGSTLKSFAVRQDGLL